uniref:Magnesium-dependent phosphatase 1 n=1 Tax=Chenopodium quinoa TaxID=63459 RepID=A0A803KXA5_CHEQI
MAEQREEEMEELQKVKSEAAQIINGCPILPLLIVFDLDYTLWPFFCECYDEDDMPWLYPQARGILCALKDRGIEMAIASRSPASDVAKAFLAKLGIESMFVAQLECWTHKTEHFQRIHDRTGTQFDLMLFFDDENRNIEAITKMGVTCILVNRGLNLEALRQGLTNFSQKSLGMNGKD